MQKEMRIFIFHENLVIMITWEENNTFGFKIRRDGIQELDWCEKKIKEFKVLLEKVKQAVEILTSEEEG
ncbi:MAG: hypothetical protein IPP74_10335 [Alphaproteobacteria bacterium]|nr:hypothetical protein [Alphaproteobacteria bacterium]